MGRHETFGVGRSAIGVGRKSSGGKGVEYPISNKELPMMKERIVDLQVRSDDFMEDARKNKARG